MAKRSQQQPRSTKQRSAGKSVSGAKRPKNLAGIVSTPGICGGVPRIDGTRVPVWCIANFVRVRRSLATILESYPSLTMPQVKAALEYAAKHRLEINQQILAARRS